MDSNRLWIAAALVSGVAVRLWQYLGNSSLWIDELALARNILERSTSGLVGTPLDFEQVAPPGFLLLVKAATSLFGNSEYAFRLVPLLGALIALPLLLALARRVLTASAVPVATVLFALAPPFFRLGANVKQYSTDAAVAIAIAVLALRWLEKPGARRGLALGLSAALGVWFSQTVVFVAAGVYVGLMVLGPGPSRRERIRSLAPGGLIAAASMLGAVLTAQANMTPAGRSLMYDYWDRWFIPWHIGAAIRWPFEQLPDSFRTEYGLGSAGAVGYALLAFFGWVRLFRKDPAVTLVIVTPVLVTLAAAAAHQYPFARRLVVFLLPFAILGIGAAIDGLGAVAARWQPRARAIVVGILALPAIGALASKHPVINWENARPAWEHIAAGRAPGEPVYVYFTGWLAAGYYAPRVGVPDRDLHYGHCHADDPAGYRADLGAFAGKGRLWVFFTHALTQDRLGIVAFLDSAATRLDSLVIPVHPPFREPSASVYRYDLSAMTPGSDSEPPPSRANVCKGPAPHLPVDSMLVGWGRR